MLTQSIIPVCSAGTSSVEERTTGRNPAARHASTISGSPSQAKILARPTSAGVRSAASQKKDAVPSRVHCRTTSPFRSNAASSSSCTRANAHDSSAPSANSIGTEKACASETTS